VILDRTTGRELNEVAVALRSGVRSGVRTRLYIGTADALMVTLTMSQWNAMTGQRWWLLVSNLELYCFAHQAHVGVTAITPGNAISPRWHHSLEWRLPRPRGWWLTPAEWQQRVADWKRIAAGEPVQTIWFRPRVAITGTTMVELQLMEV